MDKEGEEMIPNVFHFVFGLKEQREPFHIMYYLCLVSCMEVNQPDAVVLHYHHEPFGPWWDRIKPRLTLRRIALERFIAQYNYNDPMVGSFRYAHFADFARLRILVEEGGIYADIDTLFLRPFPREWLSRKFIMGREKVPTDSTAGGSLCNAWIASAANAEFGRRWLEGMRQAFDGTWSNHACSLPYRLSVERPDLIDVEPERSFYALDWTPEGIGNLFEHTVALAQEAYSLHLWNHLWWSPKRFDFSRFHGDLLTVDYVAHANTTYARHARRFLPDDMQGSVGRYWNQRLLSAVSYPMRRMAGTLAPATW